ncbi:outer membrane autotransporter barrel [Ophiostoma piceae UAMH 11346]|uniref:Outer membrane autotransporter barrel n=1 Tax=Ophiostoma piceae (strain UAMH 11346) TaxID=1262450 RepID=S3D1M9_OPHP1|nr:outer membrane autotransporter barrel [Ophiostoma piceae UAMH 11346]
MLLAKQFIPLLIAAAINVNAQVDLGTALSFGVLGSSTVTNTGPTTIEGDVGVSPGTAITGFPPGIVTDGTTHAGDAVAAQAQSDALTAYNQAAGQSAGVDLTDQDLGDLRLTPGVYTFASSAQLTGSLTLDAQGNTDSFWIFQIDSTLTTATDSSVILVNGASSCNVFWQVGSSATLGSGTAFSGNILALESITLVSESTVDVVVLFVESIVFFIFHNHIVNYDIIIVFFFHASIIFL